MLSRNKSSLGGSTPEIGKIIKWVVYGLVALMAISALFGSTYVVDPGRMGVVKRWGQIIDVQGEGLHFKVPFVDDVVEIPSSLQMIDVSADAVSRDMQQVTTTVNVQYSIPPAAMKDVYTNYRGDIKALNAAVVTPGTETVTKTVTALFTAEQLVSKRPEVQSKIKEELAKHIQATGKLVLAKADLTNYGFSEAFTTAIEAKVVAEQAVLTERQNQEKKKVEAQQTVAQAEADAQAIKLRADAEAYAIQKQNQYATEMNVRMREAEAKIKTAEALKDWRPTTIGGTPLIQTDGK